MPFFPVWLKAKGLDPQMIGVVLAAPMLVRVFAIPLAARAADRRDAVRATIIVASWLGVAGYALVGLAEGARRDPDRLCARLAGAHAGDAAGRDLCAQGPQRARPRLWAGAAVGLGGFHRRHLRGRLCHRYDSGAPSDLADRRGEPASARWRRWRWRRCRPLRRRRASRPSPRQHLLRDPAFIAVLAAASLIQASHAVYYGFSALEWRGAGLDGTAIAALWALGVIAEIVLFAFSGRLPPFFQPVTLLMIGAAGAALRWAAMALDPPALALPWLQLLHALSFGATHLGALGFVARHAPAGQGATAQGYLAIAQGVAMAAATDYRAGFTAPSAAAPMRRWR